MDSILSEADVVYEYSRAQALEDGELVDVSEVAREAGWRWPVALTRAAWAGCVEVPPGVVGQDEAGRLWDVVYMAAQASKRAMARDRAPRDRVPVELHVRANNLEELQPTVRLIAHVGPGDTPEPVVTIGYPQDF